MKTKNRILAGVAAIAAGILLLSVSSSSRAVVMDLKAQEFSAKTQEPGVVTLDFRRRDEFIQGHITGATNVNLPAGTSDDEISSIVDENVSNLDKLTSYAIYCHFGCRSAIAAMEMEKLGFAHVFHLQNGIVDWIAQGMPIVTSK